MSDEEDLGALCARATRRLMELERPLLDGRGLSMWGYAVLSFLARHPAPTQLALAQGIGHDKTRLIGLLDDLERAGLVTRERDPRDRRARVVELTEAGRARHAAARTAIRAMEEEVLDGLDAGARAALRAALEALAR